MRDGFGVQTWTDGARYEGNKYSLSCWQFK